jgi:hypothetical protein
MRSLEQKCKRVELIEEYRASRACALFNRLKVHELGYRIFLANYEEWQRSIDAKCPNGPMALIHMMQDSTWVESYLVEVTRTLHNFVASALTLVDTTRVVYHELYEPKNLLPEYQNEIDTRFIKDGTARFIKDLRQFCQHYRLPLVMAKVGLNLQPQGGHIQWGVPIIRKQVDVWRGWSAASKAFIGSFEKEIDLEAVAKEYRDKVVAFNAWFESKQMEVHAAEWSYREAMTKEIRSLIDEAEPTAAADGEGEGNSLDSPS